MSIAFLLLILTCVLYGLSFIMHLRSFSGKEGHRFAFALMRIGFLCATFYLAAEATQQDFFLPVSNLSQALAFFAWSLAFVYLVLLVKIQSESFGLILSPILFILLVAAGVSKALLPVSAVSTSEAFSNPYFVLHIAGAFFAYASFTLSFSAGILYLIQQRELKVKNAGTFYHKLPSLEELEKLIYQPLIWGTPLLALAVGVGMVWSKLAYGEYWLADPKTILTMMAGILYTVILGLRYGASLRGKQAALLSLATFALVIFSFVGTRFIQSSHNYSQ